MLERAVKKKVLSDVEAEEKGYLSYQDSSNGNQPKNPQQIHAVSYTSTTPNNQQQNQNTNNQTQGGSGQSKILSRYVLGLQGGMQFVTQPSHPVMDTGDVLNKIVSGGKANVLGTSSTSQINSQNTSNQTQSGSSSQTPTKVTIAVPAGEGQPLTMQTGIGTLTFVGWADPDRHFEVWQDSSGKQYVRNIGGKWWSGEDFAKAQMMSQDYLNKVNVIEIHYFGSGFTNRYFKEGDKWYTFTYDPKTNSYTKVEVPAEKIQQDVFSMILGFPTVNVSGYNVPDIEKYAPQAPDTFMVYGAVDAIREAKLKQLFGTTAIPAIRDKLLADKDIDWSTVAKANNMSINDLATYFYNNPDAYTQIRNQIIQMQKEYGQAVSNYTDENKLKQLYNTLRQLNNGSASLNEDIRLLKQHRAMLLENQNPQQYDMLPQVKNELQSVLGGQLPDWSNLSPEQKNIISQYLMLSDPTLQKYIGDKVTLNFSQLTDDQRKILSRFIGEDKIRGSEVTLSIGDAKKVLAGLLYMTLHPEELYAEQLKKQYGKMYGESNYLPTTLASGIVSSAVTGAPPTPKQQNAIDVGVTSFLRFGGITDLLLGYPFKLPPSTGQVTGQILSQTSEELRRQLVEKRVKEHGFWGWLLSLGEDPYMTARVLWDPSLPGQFFGELNKFLSETAQNLYSLPAPFHVMALPFIYLQATLNAPGAVLDLVTKVIQTHMTSTIEGFVFNLKDPQIAKMLEEYGLDRFATGWSGLTPLGVIEIGQMIKDGKIDKGTLGELLAIRDTIPKNVADAYYIGDAVGNIALLLLTEGLGEAVEIDAPEGLKTVEDAENWAGRVFGDKAKVITEGEKIKIQVPRGELLKFKLLDKLPWDIELPKNVVEKYGKDIGKLRDQIAKNLGDPNVEIYQAPDGKYYVSTSWAYRVPLELEFVKAPISDVIGKIKARVEEPAKEALEKIGKAMETGLDKSKQVYLEVLRATKEELDKLLPDAVKKELENVADKILRRKENLMLRTNMNGETEIVVSDMGNVKDLVRYVDNGKVVVRQTLKGGEWITPKGLQEKSIIEAVKNAQKFIKELREKYPDREFIGMAVLDNKGEVWVKIYEVFPTEVSKGITSGFEFLKNIFSMTEKEGEGVNEVPVDINGLLSKRDPYEIVVYKLFYEMGDKERNAVVDVIRSIDWSKKVPEKIPGTLYDFIEELRKVDNTSGDVINLETLRDAFNRIASKDLSQLERDANYVAGYLLRNMPTKDAVEFIIKKVFKGDEKKVDLLKDFVNKVEKVSKDVSGKIGVEPAEAEKALVDLITNFTAQKKGYSEAYWDIVTRITEKMLMGEQIKPEEGFALLLREFLGDKEKVEGFLESFKKNPRNAVANEIYELPVSIDLKDYLADNLVKIVEGLPKDLDGFIKMADDAFSKVKSNTEGLSPWESFVLKLKELEKSGKISSDKAEEIINTVKKLAEETVNNDELWDALGKLSRLIGVTVTENVKDGKRPFIVGLEDVEKAKKGEEITAKKTTTLSTEKGVPREIKVSGTYSVDIETFRKGAKIFNEFIKNHRKELEQLLTDPKNMTQLIEAVAKAYLTGDYSFIDKALDALEDYYKKLETQENIAKAVEKDMGEASVNAGKTAGAGGLLQKLKGELTDFIDKIRKNEKSEEEAKNKTATQTVENKPQTKEASVQPGNVYENIEYDPETNKWKRIVEELSYDESRKEWRIVSRGESTLPDDWWEKENVEGLGNGKEKTGASGVSASLGAKNMGTPSGSGATVSSGGLQLVQTLREMPRQDLVNMFYFLGNMPFVDVVEDVGAPQALTGLYNSIVGLGKGAMAYGKKVWNVAGKTIETPMIVATGASGRNYAIFVPKNNGGNMLVNIRVDMENKATVDIYGDKQSFEEVKPVIRDMINKLGVKVVSANLVPDVSGYGGLDDARLSIKEKAGVVVVKDMVSTKVGDNIVTGNVSGVATPSCARMVFELSGVEGKAGGEVVVTSDGKAEVTVYGSGKNMEQAEEVGKKIASSLGASPANINVVRSGETLLSDVRKDAENVKIIPSGILKTEGDIDLKKFWDKYGVMPDFVLEIVGKDKDKWFLFRKLPEALLQLARESVDVILGLKPSYEPVVAVAQIPEITTELQLKTDQITVTKQADVPIVKITRPPLIPILLPAPGTAPPNKGAEVEKQNLKQREKLVI
ncbi:MAG: hypothetical protein JHC26_05610 [Thermofilum sp.]|jgi:hypothetical protein|uniref:hypothetical protein n=1 Tax=Thermofilum sp. TaxID=1961369 RepID=UPI00258F6F2B|nr:hypothetical protein [Thermofilum sp.]MCI4408548.1 hypothetical protein [Thermofilum sp.]